MVRAILNGTKTQTRRACKNKVYGNGFMASGHQMLCHNDYLPPSALLMDYRSGGYDLTVSNIEGWGEACPYGQPGEHLWVRETWAAPHSEDGRPPRAIQCDQIRIHYAASEERGGLLWRPSIHMPRWASRITLEITGVRVERLQDISEADAINEGIESLAYGGLTTYRNYALNDEWAEVSPMLESPIESYRSLWESINGAGSWDANPWVWIVEFNPNTQSSTN